MARDNLVKAILLHLSFNQWGDRDMAKTKKISDYSDRMQTEFDVWREVIDKAADDGFNTIVIDLGDAVRYKSHPEIAQKDAWSVEKLKEELSYIRSRSMTPIPKLNFSNSHNAWMKDMKRRISTPEYYSFCEDLINEVCEIFEKPQYFHIGMDEENDFCQSWFDFACIRRGELLWHDLNFFIEKVKRNGSIPWMWADLYWSYGEEFVKRVPKDVVLSPWFYLSFYAPLPDYKMHEDWHDSPKSFKKISDSGFGEIPAGSNFNCSSNMKELVRFSEENIKNENLKGYLLTLWKPMIDEYRYTHLDAIHLSKYAFNQKEVD